MSNQNPQDGSANSAVPATNPSKSPELDSKYPHLRIEAAKMLGGSIDDRCFYVNQDRFIPHERAKVVLAKLKEIYRASKGIRPPCVAFVGGSNEGKSATIARFVKDHMPEPKLLESPDCRIPILVVEAPPRATEPRLCLAFARGLGLPGYGSSASRIVSDIVYRALERRGVQMVIINEAQHSRHLSKNERLVACDFVKSLSNKRISVVAVGTDELLELYGADAQNSNRMRVIRLGCFALNEVAFRDFLHSLESYYPLPEPSNLGSKPLLNEIYNRTNGICGEVIMLCNAAAEAAIKSGKPRIDYSLLKTVQVLPPAANSALASLANAA